MDKLEELRQMLVGLRDEGGAVITLGPGVLLELVERLQSLEERVQNLIEINALSDGS